MLYRVAFFADTDVTTDWLFQLDSQAIYGLANVYTTSCIPYEENSLYVYYDSQAFSHDVLLMTFDLPVYNGTTGAILYSNRFERCSFPIETTSSVVVGLTTCDIGFSSDLTHASYTYFAYNDSSAFEEQSIELCGSHVGERVLVYKPPTPTKSHVTTTSMFLSSTSLSRTTTTQTHAVTVFPSLPPLPLYVSEQDICRPHIVIFGIIYMMCILMLF
jgi:hypothetical protein